MRRLLTGTVFGLFLFSCAKSQTINITSITAAGRFNSCIIGSPPLPAPLPAVTATLVASTGTSLVNGTLVCNDPCGISTLRIVLSDVRWDQDPDDNWIHGIFFPTNPGFSVSGIVLPAGWNSFASCTGASCSLGQSGGQGFYFDGTFESSCCGAPPTGDGIPNNNWGDRFINCNTPLSFQFDMTFCNSAITGSQLSFQLSGTADGNTGCYDIPDASRNNRINFSISTTSCPDIYTVPFTSTIITDCSVTPINYYAQMNGGCGNGTTVTWWDAPFGGNQIGTGVPFTYDPAGNACPAGTVLYASCCPVGATNCANRQAVTITGTCPPGPNATHTKTDPPCFGINGGTISVTPNTGGPFTITLTGPGGPYILTGPAPVIFTGLAAGTYNYSFTDAGGCSGSGGPVVLVANPEIFTPVVITNPRCNGAANGTVTFNPIGGIAPYQYSDNGGTTYQAGNTFSGLAAGLHSFTIRDNLNCTSDTTVNLTDPSILTSTLAGTTPAGCSNNDGTASATATGGTAPYTFSITGPTLNSTGNATGVFTGLANGPYIITATDANGCTAPTGTGTVGLTDNMFLTLGPDVTICAEQAITFDPQTNPETNIFTWTPINGTIAGTIANPAIKNAVATPKDTATYRLHAQWGGCERWDTIVVNLLHKPIPDAGKDTAICNLTYAILRGNSSNLSGPVNYAWSPAPNVEFPTQAVTRVYPPGNNRIYTYTLTVKDDYGCNFTVTDQVDVTVQPPVPAYAGNDTTAVLGIPHQLFSSGGRDYLWSPSAVLNSSTMQNPLATLMNDQKFVVRVTDVAGCIGYDSVFVKAYAGPAYYIPNAFTPNGDGLNDVFRPVPAGIVITEWFRIFNRLGETVFENNEYMKGWDGTFRGQKQPTGAYVWIIRGVDRNGKKVDMRGSVMLVH
ncbi:MAG: gliding motility-associated C-terminal domain-containing protein [Rhizobacter sp.]|nr:gliding motility-associated C-terminal domain-containing protein [Ferruginibacter sp.]